MIHLRFKQYLGVKMLTQKEIAQMAELTENQVSRFCRDGNISVLNLQKLLQVCGDLSLEFLFFGYGPMIKEQNNITVHHGQTNYNTQIDEGSVVVQNGNENFTSQRNHIKSGSIDKSSYFEEIDRILSMKDEIISKRDETISSLNKTIVRLTELLTAEPPS